MTLIGDITDLSHIHWSLNTATETSGTECWNFVHDLWELFLEAQYLQNLDHTTGPTVCTE